jgi:hypothetical protein
MGWNKPPGFNQLTPSWNQEGAVEIMSNGYVRLGSLGTRVVERLERDINFLLPQEKREIIFMVAIHHNPETNQLAFQIGLQKTVGGVMLRGTTIRIHDILKAIHSLPEKSMYYRGSQDGTTIIINLREPLD